MFDSAPRCVTVFLCWLVYIGRYSKGGKSAVSQQYVNRQDRSKSINPRSSLEISIFVCVGECASSRSS